MKMTRRELLTLVAVPLGLGLSRCGGGDLEPQQVAARAATFDPELDCTSTIGMWPAETVTRTNNHYMDRSDREDRYCFNCGNYQPAPGGKGCGGCGTVKGPINPLGLCDAWTVRRD